MSLRIKRPMARAATLPAETEGAATSFDVTPLAAPGEVVTPKEDSFEDWMQRLVMLIPVEIVSVYTLLRDNGGELWKLIIWPLIFLALTFAFRAFATREDNKSPQWLAAGIASVAFVFWVYITGGNFFGWAADTQVMSGLMLVFMLVVSKWYKGD